MGLFSNEIHYNQGVLGACITQVVTLADTGHGNIHHSKGLWFWCRGHHCRPDWWLLPKVDHWSLIDRLFSPTLDVFDLLSGLLVVTSQVLLQGVLLYYYFFFTQSADSSHSPPALATSLCHDSVSPNHLQHDYSMSFLIKAPEIRWKVMKEYIWYCWSSE